MALTAKQAAAAEPRRQQLVEICRELPEVDVQVVGEGHLAIRVRKKTFAYYLYDHHGDGRVAFCCKSTLSEQRQLVRQNPASYFVPPYLGPKGWVAMRLDSVLVNWTTVAELIREAYRKAAPKKLAGLVQ